MTHIYIHLLQRTRRTLLLLLPFLCLTLPLRATDVLPDGFCVNGVPVAEAYAQQRIYAVALPDKNGELTVHFSAAEPLDSLIMDGEMIAEGQPVTLTSMGRSGTHTLRFSGQSTLWKLYFTSFPLVSLSTTHTIVTDKNKEASFTLIDPLRRTDGVNYVFQHRVGMHIRGASASSYPKKSFAVELWNDLDEEEDATILGMRSDGDIILDAAAIDYSRMRNRVLTDIWNEMDSIPWAGEGDSKENGTVGHYVEMIYNGKYHGLYCLTDKIDRKKLHLKKTDVTPDGYMLERGMLYKARIWTDATFLNYYNPYDWEDNATWNGWEQKYPDPEEMACDFMPLQQFIEWAAPKMNADEAVFHKSLEEHIYPQNIANYLILLQAFCITDNHIKNTYLSQRNTQKDQRFLLTPWDMDASFGRLWDGKSYMGDSFVSKRLAQNGLLHRLLGVQTENDDFRALLRNTWDRLKTNLLSPYNVEQRLKNYAQEFRATGAWTREQARWSSGSGTALIELGDINKEVDYMMRFYRNNFETVDAYLSSFPTAIDEVTPDRLPLTILPQGNRVRVLSPSATTAEIRLFTSDGQRILQGVEGLPFTSPALAPGVYVVWVKKGNTSVREKVIVR